MKKKFQMMLTINNFKLLMKYYFSKKVSVFNKKRLKEELNGASIVKEDSLPLSVVRPGSKVLVRNTKKRQLFRIHIADEGLKSTMKNIISITDPLSIALLGYSRGHKTEWELPDGVNEFEIISVA